MASETSQDRQSEDILLITKVKSGDVSAMDTLLLRYIPQLTAFFRYLRVPDSQIDDMVQATFERMIVKIDSYDEQKKFSVWLLTVGRNLYFDECRRDNRQKTNSLEKESFAPQFTPEDEIVVKHTTLELLSGLTEAERFLLECRVFEGMPFAEIAELLGEEATTLRSRFFRLMGKLRVSAEKTKSA